VIPVVVLAGGHGTRLREETAVRPKPMVEIGGKPILWHIMKIYDHYGFTRFVIPVGYKGHLVKEFFLGYRDRFADFTIELAAGELAHHSRSPEDWSVTVVDTGPDTQTGGRIKRLADHLDGRFMVTYGDGVSDVDVKALMDFHEGHGKLASMTVVRPPARFGAVDLDGDRVAEFTEKSQAHGGWINGGFMVFEREVLSLIADDETVLEQSPLESLAQRGELMAYQHSGFWEPMDTQRDLDHLNEQWTKGTAPWKVWRD
jgi:glucose-1-phosphate cytidylyltransferase